MERRVFLVGAAALVIIAIVIPYFPRGTDLYVHVLWPWQVMRCLHTGTLPVWLPDLNASFGSPGIGLYSPLGPLVCGALGLIFGTGGRGVRAALALTALAVVAAAPGRSRGERLAKAAVVLLSPAVLTEFLGRFPVSQLLGVPLAWLLLEIAADRRWRWDRDGILFTLLWLVHAPTAVMVGMLSMVAAVTVRPGARRVSEDHHIARIRAWLLESWQLGAAGLVAAGLSLWHWWPLVSAAPDFPLRSALTGGEHHPLRNLIGVSGPHLPEINIAMGWTALGLLAALVASGGWKSARGRLAILAIVLVSLLSAPLWRYVAPLAWLQFPWRWMLPATLLATTAILDAAAKRGRFTLGISLAAIALPLAALPEVGTVPDPKLTVGTEAVEAGERVMESFSGNPLLIDVMEHRPLWWGDLAQTMGMLGPRQVALVPDAGVARVTMWRPLQRRIAVESTQPAVLVLRLLADRHWKVTVNGQETTPGRWGAGLAASIPSGRSEVKVAWATDPRAIVGMMVALIIITAIVLNRWRLRRGRQPECEQ